MCYFLWLKILDHDCKTFLISSWLISWENVCISFNCFVFFDHPFQLFVEIRKNFYTQNAPPYHQPCVADFFFAYPLVVLWINWGTISLPYRATQNKEIRPKVLDMLIGRLELQRILERFAVDLRLCWGAPVNIWLPVLDKQVERHADEHWDERGPPVEL